FIAKWMQSPKIQIVVTLKHIDALAHFGKQYRESGFTIALIIAKEQADNMGVEAMLEERRVPQKKCLLSYEGQDNPEENFKVEYFNVILDTAIISIQSQFQQFKIYEDNFGFLYNISSLKGWENVHLMDQCKVLHDLLQDPDSMSSESDIDTIELCEEELQMLSSLVPEKLYCSSTATTYVNGVYPNASIALRLPLTIPVTVALGERFSCLKLIKTYLRSFMSQERLGLAQLSIESDVTNQLDYSDILQDISSVKARKKTFYGD
uniref:Uncharacterized protein n=1 Tax=Latimeria chalumnae TaxID=7897 RepID=H2ZXZ5_LATCH